MHFHAPPNPHKTYVLNYFYLLSELICHVCLKMLLPFNLCRFWNKKGTALTIPTSSQKASYEYKGGSSSKLRAAVGSLRWETLPPPLPWLPFSTSGAAGGAIGLPTAIDTSMLAVDWQKQRPGACGRLWKNDRASGPRHATLFGMPWPQPYCFCCCLRHPK